VSKPTTLPHALKYGYNTCKERITNVSSAKKTRQSVRQSSVGKRLSRLV
jgi:hypothetical protein